MNYCPITYTKLNPAETYSREGLRLLSPQLKNLSILNLTAPEQREAAMTHSDKMSIQGIQSKLSAQLKIKKETFEIVEQKGTYILKPPSPDYPELPENEAISMTLAQHIGIEVPVHGLLYAKDNSMTYFIKRFDRAGHHDKLPVEDFAQLSGATRDTKYNSSMEEVVKIIKNYCSFPKIELLALFRLTLFNYLIGNEDMHLKNFSLITKNNKILLSPAYDLLNTTIALKNPKEELALPLNGKKNNLTKKDFFKYFALERLELNSESIDSVTYVLKNAFPQWQDLLNRSFLSLQMKRKYLDLIQHRFNKLAL